jgi:hypothetical protein
VVTEYSSTDVEHADETEREGLAHFGIALPKDEDLQIRDELRCNRLMNPKLAARPAEPTEAAIAGARRRLWAS